MPPCEHLASGLGCHYFRCPMHACPSSTQRPLKPTERSRAVEEALLFYSCVQPFCWKITNSQILPADGLSSVINKHKQAPAGANNKGPAA